MTTFYLAIYDSRICAQPLLVWQVYVHAVESIAIASPLGQTTRASLHINGFPTSRTVQCFSANPMLLLVRSWEVCRWERIEL